MFYIARQWQNICDSCAAADLSSARTVSPLATNAYDISAGMAIRYVI